MNLNFALLTIVALLVLAGTSYWIFRIYKKKKIGSMPNFSEPSVFEDLGKNESSAPINEHFVFPETNKEMSEKMLNKFKIDSQKKTEEEVNEEKPDEETKKEPNNELEKLKKDYDGDKFPTERGFEFNLTDGIISHEILRKKNKGKSNH